MQLLKDTIAVVTGASRGAGRGIALQLGAAGATVYVTGRSVRGGATTQGRAETIDETAELVTARGGTGIPVRCDHTDDADVARLFARVQRERGRLDLLVNNVFGGNERSIELAPFWEQPLEHWDEMFTAGVRAHIVASRFALPLMLPQRRGLIVVTTSWDRDRYLGHFFYDLAKSTLNRLAFGMAQDLHPHGITAVAVSPGWMRTERVLEVFGATGGKDWRDVPDLARTETPEYVGRAVVALASDPDRMAKTGQTLMVGELAQEYGFTDVDGRYVPPFRPGEG